MNRRHRLTAVQSGSAAWAGGLLAAALAACGPRPPALGDANLLLITLDTLRADRLGAYGYGLAETPRLDALAREGVLFEQAMTVAPLTLPAHASLLSGLIPPRHGLRNNGAGKFPAAPPTLATVLGGAGYRTGAFVGAFVLDHRFGLDRGFEVYDDEVPRDPTASAGGEPERPAAAVVDRALAWLEGTAAGADSRPFFAWVHLYDAHAPYEPPPPFRERHSGRPYDGEIAALDKEVGRLVDFAARQRSSRLTLVAVAGDHGEALGEHGELTHGLLLYEPTLWVPLLLHAPAAFAAGRVREPVSVADLAPTLVGLLGLGWSGATDGRDLSASLRAGQEPARGDLYAETEYPATFGWSGIAALRRGDWKFIAAPRPELYDLAADPAESNNAWARERRLQAELGARIQPLRALGAAAPATALDPETRAQLAALGYATAPARPPGSATSQRDPKDAVPLFRAFEEAHWALLEGRFQEAAGALRALVAQDPGNPVFHDELAGALRKSGDLDGAVAEYRRAAEAAAHDPQAWYELAVALRDAGRGSEATSTLEIALRLDPQHAEAQNIKGVLASLRGDQASARTAFTRAVTLDPANATAWNNLGNALRDGARLDEAAQAYRKAIALAPRYADPLNGLGVLEVQRRRPAVALPLFDAALALAPDRHEVRLNRAIAQQALGNRRAAIASYRDFLSAVGNDPAFRRERQAVQELLAAVEDAP